MPAALAMQPYPVHGAFATAFTPQHEHAAAQRTLGYLQAQLAADGAFTGNQPSDDSSELFVIGAAAAGFDPNTLHNGSGASVVQHLRGSASTDCTTSVNTTGGCGRLVQAIIAAGDDPANFGGIDPLSLLEHHFDAATGAYGDGETFTQSLAIQAVVNATGAWPANALLLLADNQDSDGGWNYKDSKDDPVGSDTNSTAMALMALDAAGDHTFDAAALAWLRTQQDTDGGFPYQAGDGTDPDSTALVIQAIVATGDDATTAAWAKVGATALNALVMEQTANGGYTYPGNAAPDVLTSAQVPPGLERAAFPVPFRSRAFYAPGASLTGSASPPAAGSGTPSVPSTGGAADAVAWLLLGAGGLIIGCAGMMRVARKR
ncbi:MAG: hypothetical protein JOY68_05495 [Candidatus Dormibacteraeota bacterium]|nr:hypothetical protein [Candidatus Dormibacteraeota bacterium]